MKKILVLLVATLGIFCFCSVAMAEGITVYGEYGMLSYEIDGAGGDDMTTLTLGGEYNLDPFVVGGSYSFALSYDPEPAPGEDLSDNIFMVYGGYKLLDNDTIHVYGLGGYYSWSETYDDGVDELKSTVTSIAVGAKGVFNFEPLTVTASVMFGLSNEMTLDINGFELGSADDLDCTVFEIKGAYQFSDALSAYAAYRNYTVDITDGSKLTLGGLCLGLQYAF